MSYTVSQVGPWTVHEGVVMDLEGATTVTVISDGVTEWMTPLPVIELVVALMNYLGVEVVSASTLN